jgi:hypothetical protein
MKSALRVETRLERTAIPKKFPSTPKARAATLAARAAEG